MEPVRKSDGDIEQDRERGCDSHLLCIAHG